MDVVKVQHRGHEILFDGGSEEWKCGAFALADKSLAKVKAAIDRAAATKRRVSVEALYFEDDNFRDRWTIRRCTIVLLREGDRKADVKFPGTRGQSQVGMSELYALDQKPKLEELIAAKRRAHAAQRDVSALEDRLEPLTAVDVREAIARQAEDAA